MFIFVDAKTLSKITKLTPMVRLETAPTGPGDRDGNFLLN